MLRTWRIVTDWLKPTDYDALRAKVNLRAKQTVTGDLLGDVMGRTGFQGDSYRTVAGDVVQKQMTFELWEAA